MAAGRDNSSNLGSGISTWSPTHENWIGGILHTVLVVTSQKNTHFNPFKH
jgi:hypothetical protein